MAGPAEVAVEIQTSSQYMQYPSLPAPQFPQITLNGNPLPAPQFAPQTPNGWQVVVFDMTQDITTPEAIISNQYLQLYAPNGLWGSTYQYMYQGIVGQVLTSGNIESQLVFVVSYGLDVNMSPSNDGLELFLSRGAGPELQKWATTVDTGSEGGYVGSPGNYVLIGSSQDGYGEGAEQYDYTGSSPVETNVQVTIGNE